MTYISWSTDFAFYHCHQLKTFLYIKKWRRLGVFLPLRALALVLTVHGLSRTAERLSISISQQLIMPQTMLTGAQKLKAVMRMPVEKK